MRHTKTTLGLNESRLRREREAISIAIAIKTTEGDDQIFVGQVRPPSSTCRRLKRKRRGGPGRGAEISNGREAPRFLKKQRHNLRCSPPAKKRKLPAARMAGGGLSTFPRGVLAGWWAREKSRRGEIEICLRSCLDRVGRGAKRKN